MTGQIRKVFVGLAMALLLALVLPAAIAVAQESDPYPPSPTVSPATASRADDPNDPGAAATRLAFTGSSDTIPTVLIAVGVVVFGGALIVVARQRRSAADRT